MPDPAKPPTSEEEGKNPEGKPEGEGTPPKPKPEDAPKFTQDDQNALAAKIRKEEKEKYERKQAEEKKAADEAKAREQGEHKQLAEKYEGELKVIKPQLETAQTEVEKYKSAVADVVKAELKALPEEVRDISPAQYAEDKSLTNPLDVLAWLPKGKALAAKLDGQPAKPGAKADPKANGSKGDAEAEKRARAEARRAYRD